MIAPLLALFVRSLREDSRRNLTYFARSGLVLVILLFLLGIQDRMGWANAPGLSFFDTVIHIDLCAILLAGVSYFSSAISEEKEDMTLGLLRMTNLNPLSILLGKSTSRLCAAALLFAAQVPFTLLAITLGGISLHQVLSAYAATAAFLVLISNVALFASVIGRRTAESGMITGILLVVFFAVPPLAESLAQLMIHLGWLSSGDTVSTTLNAMAAIAFQLSPFISLNSIFRSGYMPGAFTIQVWSNLVIGLVFFLLAWVSFNKFCGEQKEVLSTRGGAAVSPRKRWKFLSPGRPSLHAISWKDFNFLAGGKLWLGIKFLVYGAPIIAARWWPEALDGPMPWDELGAGIFFLMLAFIGVELAFAAASIFRVERQGKTLSSLAMLPQGIRKVAYEKVLGILPSLGAAGLYLLLSLPLIVKFIERAISQSHTDDVLAFLIMVAQAVFFLHLVANLSLRVHRAALPLALGIHILLVILASTFSFDLFDGKGGMVLVLILTLGATGFLHINTGYRLVELAAEDS